MATALHRVIQAPPPVATEPDIPLPPAVRVLRLGLYLVAAAMMALFLTGGTVESRVCYALLFALGFANPIWGFYALALAGPLYLLDQSKTHMLAGLEVLFLGVIVGDARLWGYAVDDGLGGAPGVRPDSPRHWGIWPAFLVGLWLLLLASATVGIQLLLFSERPPAVQPVWYSWLLAMFYEPAVRPEWTLRGLWNWGTGMYFAWIAARRLTPIHTARLMKIGAAALLFASVFAILDVYRVIDLTLVRRTNPDPLQIGRLQGLAGHPGWFAQWLLFFWPGLLLWLDPRTPRRNALVAGALLVVVLALVLTGARAGWLGALVGASAAVFWAATLLRMPRRTLVWLALAAAVALVLGLVLGGPVLWNRLQTILRSDDRANYYVSGLLFLRDYPWGIGLGTHFQFYGWWLTPFYKWAQTDFVDAHSVWLHTLIENGPAVPAALAIGLLFAAREGWRARHHITREEGLILGVVALAVLGIVTNSVAQYVVYLRVMELGLWMFLGILVGNARRAVPALRSAPLPSRRPLVLLGFGAVAVVMAAAHFGRVDPGNMPRDYERQPKGTLAFWTGREWSTPVNREVWRLHVGLLRYALPTTGRIVWPDGSVQPFRLGPGESASFTFEQQPSRDRWTAPLPRVRVEVDTLWTPANHMEGSTDVRQLGVFVTLQVETESRGRAEWW